MTEKPRPFRYRGDSLERRAAWFAIAGGVGMFMLIYGPVLWLALMSISAEPLSGIPGPFTLRWYDKLFADLRWVDPLLNSLAVGAAVGLSCAAASLLVARQVPAMRRRGLLLVAFLLPLFIPGVLIGVSLFLYFRVILGLQMGWWSLFVGHFSWAYPFSLIALLVNTTRFDARLLDAAGDLGASPWRRFWDIEFPLILPGVVAAALFGFLLSFNELSRSILLSGRVETLPIFEWAQASAHTSNVPLIFSLSTLVLLASMALVCTAFMMLFGRHDGR